MKRDWTLVALEAAIKAVALLFALFGLTIGVLAVLLALFALLGGNP